MFFLLTNIVLDITLGTIWWTTKNTTLILYNGIIYIKDTLLDKTLINYSNDSEYIILTLEEYNKLKLK